MLAHPVSHVVIVTVDAQSLFYSYYLLCLQVTRAELLQDFLAIGGGCWGQLELNIDSIHNVHHHPSSCPLVPLYAQYVHHLCWGVSTHIKKQASSLLSAFPKDPTSVILLSVVRLLHWPFWNSPCSYCFTCQAFNSRFLMVNQIRELNLLEKNFFFFLIFGISFLSLIFP